MAQYIFTMHQVSKTVPPGRAILRDISLSFYPGAKIGILGSNGSGKSTLLKIMAGIDKDFSGEARPQPGVKIGYLPQEPQLDDKQTVRDAIEEGVHEIKSLLTEFDKISERFAEPMSDDEMTALLEKQGELQHKIEAAGGWELDRKLEIAASALRVPAWESLIGTLSGGERRRVALCRLLLSNPDMLLLDEPTNHLDAESVAWLERFLHDYPGTVIAVTHDRYFLDNVAGWILELDRGHGIPYEGNYSSWLEQKNKRLELEERQESAFQKVLKAELEWVRTAPKARASKSKARMDRFEELSNRTYQKRQETNSLYIPPGPYIGDSVFTLTDVKKQYEDRVLFQDLSFLVPKGAVVGIIGPNGAGKSTLFKLLAGKEQPDSGDIKVGETVQVSYVEQTRDSLTGENTVWKEISDGHDIMKIGQYEINSRAYVGRFNFKGDDQQKYVANLSGGERNRVHLAKLLKAGGNTLLLDEPTNDLDVETIRALEEAILEFPGNLFVISHDRWFLDRIATHMIAFEDDGSVVWFNGNFTDYEADRVKRLGADALTPRRFKYKKIS